MNVNTETGKPTNKTEVTMAPPMRLAKAIIRAIASMVVILGAGFVSGITMTCYFHFSMFSFQCVVFVVGMFLLTVRISWSYWCFGPAAAWFQYSRGQHLYLNDSWLLDRRSTGAGGHAWEIHQSGSQFITPGNGRMEGLMHGLRGLADRMKTGAHPQIAAIKLPAGFLSEKMLKRGGFECHRPSPLSAKVGLFVSRVFFDEVFARYRIVFGPVRSKSDREQRRKRLRDLADPEKQCEGVISRAAFIERFS